jgi:exonuclease III
VKQKQIEDFIKQNNIDILHCQEIEVCESTFESCNFISSSFEIIQNNSPTNKYGTASLIRNDLIIDNINLDTNGRAITFDVGNVTFCNLYLHSGNDRIMRSGRESYLAETIPQLLVNARASGCISGDFNCITDKKDATRNPENKMSASLKRLVKTFSWRDSYRHLFPNAQNFSRYYDSDRFGEGATRIDRTYYYGDVAVKEAQYVGVAFSDHMSLIVKFALPGNFGKLTSPKSRPLFKANPDIVRDPIFKARKFYLAV